LHHQTVYFVRRKHQITATAQPQNRFFLIPRVRKQRKKIFCLCDFDKSIGVNRKMEGVQVVQGVVLSNEHGLKGVPNKRITRSLSFWDESMPIYGRQNGVFWGMMFLFLV
jgi:hypothetical protein